MREERFEILRKQTEDLERKIQSLEKEQFLIKEINLVNQTKGQNNNIYDERG